MAARAVVLLEESAQKHSGNVDQSPHTNNFRKERGGMQGQGSADERQSKPRWVEIEHTRPTERPRDTQGMGQTYLADRPRRPARARSEIAGSDRAVVCGPPLSACARSWAAAAAAAAAAAVQIRRMALPLIHHVHTRTSATEGRQTIFTGYSKISEDFRRLHLTAGEIEYRAYGTCSPCGVPRMGS